MFHGLAQLTMVGDEAGQGSMHDDHVVPQELPADGEGQGDSPVFAAGGGVQGIIHRTDQKSAFLWAAEVVVKRGEVGSGRAGGRDKDGHRSDSSDNSDEVGVEDSAADLAWYRNPKYYQWYLWCSVFGSGLETTSGITLTTKSKRITTNSVAPA